MVYIPHGRALPLDTGFSLTMASALHYHRFVRISDYHLRFLIVASSWLQRHDPHVGARFQQIWNHL